MSATTGATRARAYLARLEAEGKLDEMLRCEILGGELVIRAFPQRRHEDLAHQRVVVHRRDDAGSYQVSEHREGTQTTARVPGLELPLAELFGDG